MEGLTLKAELLFCLKKRGFIRDLTLQDNQLRCVDNGRVLSSGDFDIAETVVLQTGDDVAERTVIFAIDSPRFDIKGVLMTCFSSLTHSIFSCLDFKISGTS